MRQSSSHRAASVLAAVLAEQGVRHAVVSPGSRNAPLVLALHLQPDIDVHVSIDERAAAHHALGMALATWTPVPVVCTSGTAALNHGPALAEAFHARVPLLSVTADRPQGVAGRGHGQTIHQTDIHRAHTVHRDVLDASVMNDEALVAAARQAIRASLHGGPGGSAGPVHLNVPFEEPLYELGATPPLSASDVAPMPPTASPQSIQRSKKPWNEAPSWWLPDPVRPPFVNPKHPDWLWPCLAWRNAARTSQAPW